MPPWWVPGNPIDLVGALKFETLQTMIEIMVKSGEVDAIMLLLMGPSGTDTKRPEGARGVDMTKVWDQMTEDVISQVQSLYDLMMKCEGFSCGTSRFPEGRSRWNVNGSSNPGPCVVATLREEFA